MAEAADIARLDQLDGWPAPEEQAEWYGDAGVERLLVEAYRGGRMHHAWLIGGPRGIGKATLAYRFVRFALTHPDPARAPDVDSLAIAPDAPAARKIAARSHPNVLTLARPWDEKGKRYMSSLTIDEIRRTIPFFGSTAGEAGWRIAIIDSADDMNANAANALLKILEEPPKRSLFLVLSHAPGRLLPTIRSRCRRLDLAPLEPAGIERALAQFTDAEPDVRRFAALAGEGSLRRAIRFLDDDAIAIGRAFARVTAQFPRFDASAAHALGDIVAQRGADEAFQNYQDLMFDWLGRRARGLPEPDAAVLPAAIAATPLARFAEVWEKVRHSSAEVEGLNLDRKQFVLTSLAMLARATRM
ncbi:DNA polymerase III subunit delta' [Kaistia dalseonensis]|uniref:DNA polymerase-3 subunit delta n=1 Tax=Kaistia dalseonensis TaxID=410840 RepID=A0ABU0H3D9_9HYPH|nr:DNA polymerase III subunit delta' [Kaistia dalseonensis]MCX5493996.1 DNA polymerase III subunit delta' [Kaistia dalseonensis]MDQ0436572.1 DNA polymerase-3 subunit delta' [Kaistia dalseonensis]